jgi:hypothetical protein
MPISLSGSLSLTGSLTVSGSMIYSGSVVSSQPITASAFLTTGTITAQTLVVSTISSSVEYASGSNIFGSSQSNRQTFTGSLYLTGSLAYFSGCVGIGTLTPSQKLEVVGGEIKAGRVDSSIEGGQVSFGRALDNNNTWYIDAYGNSTSPQLRFVNVDNSTVAMVITGSSVGIGTSSPTSHAGGNVGGLIVQGANNCRGLIEVWDGSCGKAVFQQVGGTTYLGNLYKGASGGDLQLLVNGDGSTAAAAMTLTKCGHIVVNNSPNSQADYGRMTISTCMSKLMNCSTQEHTALHLSTCESDTPFGMKIAIFGGSCSCTRYVSFQTGDHYISNQGNIIFQNSGGHVGIGCSTPNTPLYVVGEITSQNGEMYFKRSTFNDYGHIYMGSNQNFYIRQTAACAIIVSTAGSERMRIFGDGKIRINCTLENIATAGGDNYTIDTMSAYQSIANGGYIDFNGMSGMILVNNWTNGAMTAFLVGGGNTTVMGTVTGTAGTMHHSPSVGGYRWCNNYGSTANFGFQVFRTRNTA